jgi:hypothetical protein
MENISVINKRLIERFGKSIDGRANFRVVFSDTQFEKRYGTFEVYVGPLFLREETCLKEVAKYDYIDGKHVLEELRFGDFPDQPFVTSSYEPLWTFMDKDRNPLYPVWEAVEIVVVSRLEGVRNALHGKKRNFKQEEADAKEKDIKETEALLFGGNDGVHDMKNQKVNFVPPVFLNNNSGDKR